MRVCLCMCLTLDRSSFSHACSYVYVHVCALERTMRVSNSMCVLMLSSFDEFSWISQTWDLLLADATFGHFMCRSFQWIFFFIKQKHKIYERKIHTCIFTFINMHEHTKKTSMVIDGHVLQMLNRLTYGLTNRNDSRSFCTGFVLFFLLSVMAVVVVLVAVVLVHGHRLLIVSLYRILISTYSFRIHFGGCLIAMPHDERCVASNSNQQQYKI